MDIPPERFKKMSSRIEKIVVQKNRAKRSSKSE
jgi:hypothetical protein